MGGLKTTPKSSLKKENYNENRTATSKEGHPFTRKGLPKASSPESCTIDCSQGKDGSDGA